MQNGKTSRTDLRLSGRAPVPGLISKTTYQDNDAASAADLVSFDPMTEFVFSVQDPNAVTRDRIAAAAREIFGTGSESSDFIAKLVEHMLSVAESRAKIVQELIILGGNLQQMVNMAITHHTGKVGDTLAARRKAAQLCFAFFKTVLGITQPSARGYIRCHQRFADDAEAIRIFSYGELNLLAAQDVTDEQIDIIKLKKKEAEELKDPSKKMTRDDVEKLLRELQLKDEQVEDAARELENIHEILEDHKTQLEVTERESQHLREQLATYERHLAEKESSIANLRTALTERTSGYPAMEQELAAKNRKVAELTEQVNAIANAPAKVEKVEVPVEVLPAGYATAKQAVMAAYEELEDVKGKTHDLLSQKAEIEAEISRQQAELNAGKAVQTSLETLTTAWEDVSGKMSSFQLAVLASADPTLYHPALEALAAQLRKYVAEIEAALQRQ
ncbi:hypothetical protein LJ656_32325 [Paraburkholderia sp. MMS20-SJTR3]|uniref:Chromosome partition protein Smc n=1 Tax=Paraburkholderia sejongensis TaxID=2886946 RepID=A0ABS8K529_9BURK|nr:hypothetical protein [Paraburkholderia sp. MMS20-SJTR3]MCC8397262.1 hypothetical protein [Paraburkholderia sp. MMS20-SJTR3]